ncbi:tRNA (guanosine(37)-N1)-methyltransferase TrmD [Dasania sp. GY-MA-18]|uniref:tRNA (guanine-N(1)-)-methyltransferase n=1 Tax=Dasania phycosphaerae TaxID=2950436 RepID=A0A9J6RL70_9GAMM|nr:MULTISPECIES: tRNA (guanosine(37)-N1)-methyltransferase TrmD [Dasania]MCR8922708.1 tRNA (guanosine(37)-N1)-methyltransferase TrmD [Dasania sp. GY-MA-18]MCZ0865138.1 tRNA (guanosine(37)-N1)-methyltransferase TrmD [Dasania phycosphaerae]MCZ0868864.1 tRNA (guanosine(37)-N1)-methyltransferase TrmD [Dasania phycosphaerae]
MTESLTVGVITLFPEMFTAISDSGITRRALQQGIFKLQWWNPRDYTEDKHRTVDDRPYGGGPGMVMKVEPLRKALQAAKQAMGDDSKVIYLSPQGRQLDQQGVVELAANNKLIFIAGRYEGIDERLIEAEIDEEWSIGDYVLSGGELAAMVMIDAVVRQLPGALGHEQSAKEDSFAEGLLDCPHYTRPEVLAGKTVPEVLLSGDHSKIRRWRLKQALGRTWQRRPELLEQRPLSQEEQDLLASFIAEQDGAS